MVNYNSNQLDLLFYALSDPTRRQILSMMKNGTQTIGELADPFKMSLAAISKHIKILEKAKLLKREKVGRMHECSFNPEALKSAEECIKFYTKFWNESLDVFATDLEGKKITKTKTKTKTKTRSK